MPEKGSPENRPQTCPGKARGRGVYGREAGRQEAGEVPKGDWKQEEADRIVALRAGPGAARDASQAAVRNGGATPSQGKFRH